VNRQSVKYVILCLLLLAAGVLYARRLGAAPAYLSPDEAEVRARLPSVLVGLTDIVLLFFVARRMFKREALALVAAGMLALTPAHFILSRSALDYLYPVPFLLAWLLCMLSYLEQGRLRTLFAATFILGVGFYSYIAAVLVAPLYLLFTAGLLCHARRAGRDYLVAAAGFALPLTLFVPWYLAHPTAFAGTANRYQLYDASTMNALQGMRSFLSYNSIEARAATYRDFLNPSFLFFTGDLQMPFSTNAVGVFLLPVAVLFVVGIGFAIRHPTAPNVVALLGFFTAPLAAVVVPGDSEIIRAAAMLPFGVLLATMGVVALWRWPFLSRARFVLMPAGLIVLVGGLAYAVKSVVTVGHVTSSTGLLLLAGAALCTMAFASDAISVTKILAALLLLAMPLQFSRFSRDYFGDYQRRAGSWIGGYIRGALVDLIDRERHTHASYVYFAQQRSTRGRVDIRNLWTWSPASALDLRDDIPRDGTSGPATTARSGNRRQTTVARDRLE
jgi:4-amino-4-deoxy-L-arabinose transferase-like glycosyltransferase